MEVSALTPAIGAVMSGLNLAEPLSDDAIACIQAALGDHLVLFFRGQALTATHQRDFARRFGSLYEHPFYAGPAEAPEIMILENDANNRPSADRWHNDVTYLQTPPAGAVLYAEVIPPVGGDTLWANMYLAYETLPASLKDHVSCLRAVHSFAKNFTPDRFAAMGMQDRQEAIYARHPPVSHPVVRTNPTTGRKALFINQDFTTHVEGLSANGSEELLRDLYAHMAKREFQIRWRWQVGDVAFWDNRWTQHRALGDYYPQRRRVRRATIAGDRPV